MITYKCEHGHVFFENEMVQIRVMEGEYLRERYVCPDCGTEDFEEARPCFRCGDYFTEDELEYELCKECREAVDDIVDACRRSLTEPERAYAHHQYDEREGVFV